jgi:SAM-dependent methyltransferase
MDPLRSSFPEQGGATMTSAADWLARSRATWDERAEHWDQMLDERPDERERELARVVEALKLGSKPEERVLDAGCGPGQWAIGFAQRGFRVTAIDLSPAMVARAAANAERAGVDELMQLREGDVAAALANDADAQYDAIHCRCMLQFAPDPASLLRTFKRVLKPGGRLFAAVPGALSPIYAESYRRFLEPLSNTRMLPWELEGLLAALGWRVVDGWGYYGPAGVSGPNALSGEQLRDMSLPLQQAASTFWATIAEPG